MPKNKVASPSLGRRLRDIRKSKGVKTTLSLSKLMHGKYSFSSISRRETGGLRIDKEYIEDFCNALNLNIEERNALSTSAEVNFLRPKNLYNESLETWGKIRLNAKNYDSYNPNLIGYHLQTESYAKAVILAHDSNLDADSLAKLRTEDARQNLKDNSRKFRLLCHESSLYFNYGGADVMLAEMENLLLFQDEPHAEFRILPNAFHTSVPISFGINIIDNSYLFCQNLLDFSITDDPSIVSKFQTDFDLLWENSVIGLRREQMIREAIAHYKNLV